MRVIAVLFAHLAVGGLVSTEGRKDDECWNHCSGFKRCTAAQCEAKVGCTLQWLPLDKRGQACWYSEEHKLANVDEFVPHEVRYLEEKALKLKALCNARSFGPKCYRRQRQFQRLMSFLLKAVEQAKANNGPYAQAGFTEMLVANFDSVGATFEEGPVPSGDSDVVDMPSCFAEARDQLVEALSGDSDENPQLAVVKSFQKVDCSDMTAAQQAQLAALIPTEDAATFDAAALEIASDGIVSDVESVFHGPSRTPEEVEIDPVGTAEEEEAGLRADVSLVETSVQGHREGLLPYLWRKSPVSVSKALYTLWLTVQWNFLFLFAFSIRLFKVATFSTVFPASTILCFVGRGAKFLLKDVLYGGVVAGFDEDEFKQQAARPFQCPRQMAHYFNYNWGLRVDRLDRELFSGPVRFATHEFGVGPLQQPALSCGKGATSRYRGFYAGAWANGPVLTCSCFTGFSADLTRVGSDGGLELIEGQTDCRPPLINDQSRFTGCRCKGGWHYSNQLSDGLFKKLLGTKKYVNGCYNGQCEVDPSTCSSIVDQRQFIKGHGSGVVKMSCHAVGRFVEPRSAAYKYADNGVKIVPPASPAIVRKVVAEPAPELMKVVAAEATPVVDLGVARHHKPAAQQSKAVKVWVQAFADVDDEPGPT